MNKRGINFLSPEVIFIILNLIFAAIVMFFVLRAGSGADFYEEAYAKQIALMLDQAKPGTKIIIDLGDIEKLVEKEKLDINNVFRIEDNAVTVKLTDSSTKVYSHRFFSDLEKGKFNYYVYPKGSEDNPDYKLFIGIK